MAAMPPSPAVAWDAAIDQAWWAVNWVSDAFCRRALPGVQQDLTDRNVLTAILSTPFTYRKPFKRLFLGLEIRHKFQV